MQDRLQPVGAPGVHERAARALRDLLAEVEGLGSDPDPAARDELRHRARFLLRGLTLFGEADAHPEAPVLRVWLIGEGGRRADPAARPATHPSGRVVPFPGERRALVPSPAAAVRGRPVPAVAGPPPPAPADPVDGPASRGGLLPVLVGLLVAALLTLPLAAVLGSYQTYVVLTGSMAPALPVGTLLVTAPVAADAVAVGDVVTVPRPDRPGETVTHRVVRVDDGPAGRFLQTRGDANPVPDAWRVPAQGELRRVVVALPAVGRLLQAAADPAARFPLLVLPSLLLGALTLVNLWRGDRPAAAPA